MAQTKVPLTVLLCNRCGALQLKETVDRATLFTHYFYRSATNLAMMRALKNIVNSVSKKILLAAGDAVLDIGCNDGTMLSYFPPYLNRIGIDPAKNIDRSHLDPSIAVITGCFDTAAALRASGGALYRLITSIAMFYSVDDPHAFVEQIRSILLPDGIWCIQLSYLPTMIANMNFYDICHEHLLYYSLTTLESLVSSHGLCIVDAVTNDVNGGSVRVFVKHESHAAERTAEVDRLTRREKQTRLTDLSTYRKFNQSVDRLRERVNRFLDGEIQHGRTVVGLGASTKGNVLLQYFGIDRKRLPYISERNPEKVSMRTLGTDIEIISEEAARQLNPCGMLVLIWFYKQELLRRESVYLNGGGKLVFPMPYGHIVSRHGESPL